MKQYENLILGIDIGGTTTSFGIVSPAGEIICRGKVITTHSPSFKEYIKRLKEKVLFEMTASGIPIEALKAIGAGAPCVNYESGMIEGAVNLPWPSPLPLTSELTKNFNGIPAFGDNDANIAALGEMEFGAGKDFKNFIMLTLGTGVGGAVVCDGNLLHGYRGLAAELGHICVVNDPKPRKCNCGRYGCLDRYASAPGLIETAENLIRTTELPSSLRNLDELDAKSIGESAAAGDALALEALRFTGKILGKACAQFTAFSSPQAFIFFGGVANSFPLFLPAMQESFKENLLWIYDNQVVFLKSSLSEDTAAILGAAAVARIRIK